MKYCKKCDLTLDDALFGRATARKDGLQVWCKLCMNARERRRKCDSAPRNCFKAPVVTETQRYAHYFNASIGY